MSYKSGMQACGREEREYKRNEGRREEKCGDGADNQYMQGGGGRRGTDVNRLIGGVGAVFCNLDRRLRGRGRGRGRG